MRQSGKVRMKRDLKNADRCDVLKIIAIYAIFSGLWVYLSDTVLGLFITDPATLTKFSVFKGLIFVIITSVLLYQLVSRYLFESRQLKAVIRKNDELFSLLSEGMMDAFVGVEMSGKFRQFNEIYRAMVGYETEELLAKSHIDITPEKWHAMDRKIIEEELLPRGYSGIYEKEYQRKDGTVFPVELRTQLIRDDQGNPDVMWSVVRDITERKQVQDRLAHKKKELEKLNQSLAERVQEGVLELRQRDQVLFQQSRMAAMGEMISNIAHQWRQPLNNIGLILQKLQLSFKVGQLTETEFDTDVDRAMQIVKHMSGTIDDFRNFFREDKNKHPFSLAKAVELAVGLISATLKSSHIRIVLQLDENIEVIGYKNEYTQALLNIIGNAKDVLLERKIEEPRITVRAFRENGLSVVTVQDNGRGIGDSILPRIFDPYFTTKGPGEGTGIGLYMSKVIIEKNMGGRLTVTNIQGGAEFRLELPAK